jgi:hypothetical protein
MLIFGSIIRIIKSERMKWARHVARMGEKMNAYLLLVGKPERNGLLERPKCRWVNNIKMGCDGLDWIGVA